MKTRHMTQLLRALRKFIRDANLECIQDTRHAHSVWKGIKSWCSDLFGCRTTEKPKQENQSEWRELLVGIKNSNNSQDSDDDDE